MIKFRIKQTGVQTVELHTMTPFNENVLAYLNNRDGIAIAELINRYYIVATVGVLFDITTLTAAIAEIAKSYYSLADSEIEILVS